MIMEEKEAIIASLFVLLVYSAIFTFSTPSITAWIISEPNNMVTIASSGFDPSTITINKGDSVTWVNENTYTHVLFSPQFKERFTTPEIKPGMTYTHIYTNEGTFDYHEVNWGFKGEVVVKGVVKKAETEVVEQPAETEEDKEQETAVLLCYTDEDCDDNDECTLDMCQSAPVECTHIEIENCGENAVMPSATKQGQIGSAFIGGLLALAAMILAFFLLRRPAKHPGKQ